MPCQLDYYSCPYSFFEHYHHFLPLIDPLKGPDQLYEDHTCLFWVIISIASRRYTEDLTLLTALYKPVMDLVWKTIATPPHSIWMVSAMVLLVYWPFPAMTMNHNQGVTISAVALMAAQQVGLHRPKQANDFRETTCSSSLAKLR